MPNYPKRQESGFVGLGETPSLSSDGDPLAQRFPICTVLPFSAMFWHVFGGEIRALRNLAVRRGLLDADVRQRS